MEYYYMIHRPPMPGAQPCGMVDFEEYDQRRFIPEIGMEAYAKIWYMGKLTSEEIRQYELVPAKVDVTLTPAQIDLIRRAMLLLANCDNDTTEAAYDIYHQLDEATY